MYWLNFGDGTSTSTSGITKGTRPSNDFQYFYFMHIASNKNSFVEIAIPFTSQTVIPNLFFLRYYTNSKYYSWLSISTSGTSVTLNGVSKARDSASFYAPTAAGSSGQVLKSNGSGAPSWVTLATSAVSGNTQPITSGAVYKATALTWSASDTLLDINTSNVTAKVGTMCVKLPFLNTGEGSALYFFKIRFDRKSGAMTSDGEYVLGTMKSLIPATTQPLSISGGEGELQGVCSLISSTGDILFRGYSKSNYIYVQGIIYI